MKINLFYLRIIFCLLFSVPHIKSVAQQYTFRNYSVDEGLAQSQVYAMCEDNNGNIWFGTRGGGLSRFDGIDFTTYTTQEGLASNYIRCMVKDTAGNVWIGTDNGLSVYNGRKFLTVAVAEGLEAKQINDLLLDKDGTIWIATQKGIYHTEKKRIVPFALSVYEASRVPISSLIQDASGNVYAGSDHGLYRFSKNNGKWNPEHFSTDNGLPNNIITALSVRTDGGIWICTYGGGVAAFDTDTFSIITKSKGLANNTVFDCADAGNGVVWFATASGITKYDAVDTAVAFKQITETEGLAKNVVMCVLKDSFGNLWFGTSGGGVSKLSSERFIHYTAIKGVFGTWVYAILQDSSGLMWFATSEGGVTTYDGKIYKRFSERNGFTASKIKCMAEDAQGNIWFGTISDGAYVYNGKTFRHFTNKNGLSSNFINCILIDKNERVLLATAGGGISCLLPAKNNTYAIKNIRPREGLAGDRINTLVEDRQGNVWAGTANNGISLLKFSEDNSYTIKNYTVKDGLTSNVIRCAVVDNSRGVIIFGTADAGLIVYDGRKFVAVSKTQGLSSNNIYSCIRDAEGSLWIGTDKGIDCLYLSSGNGIEVIRHYGKAEGFTGIEAIQNAVCLDNKGCIWFGTVTSATVFNPAANRVIQAPRVHVTCIHLFFDKIETTPYGKKTTSWYPLPERLILPYDQNHLSFEFIGVEQSNPEAVQYKWMLDGFDKTWTPSTEKREAVYSNLPSGTYTFKVKAANERGDWSKEVATYTFTIRPPFWQTWWFILAAGMLLAVAIWWIIVSASRKLKKENMREKERLEAERTLIELEQKALRLQMNPHFLFNCLNSIKGLIAEEKPEEAKIYLSKFAKLMRSMLDHSMDAFISLENEISGLRMYTELEKLSHDDKFDFDIEIDDSIDPSFIQIPPMLIQPFVENAILHGMAAKEEKGNITVRFTQEENYLHCVIEDDGIGRAKAATLKQKSMQQHKSAAITVTQERLNILNKKLNLEAITISVIDLFDEQQQPIGTRVTVLIPFQQ